MTIGSKFLARLNEAKKPAEKKGFKFDAGTEAMKKSLRDIGGEQNLADKIVEVMNMMGVPGRFLNKPDIRDGVIEAAQNLRPKAQRLAAFLALHSALGAHFMAEAKEQDLEGQGFQQLVEEVLVSLGLPESMVTGDAAPAIKSGLRRTVAAMKADAVVRNAFVTYALRAQIKLHDSLVGAKKDAMSAMKAKKQLGEQEETEANPQDANDPAAVAAVKEMVKMLGVDLNDEKTIRVPNMPALEMKMKTAARDPVVKRAMAAFKRVMK